MRDKEQDYPIRKSEELYHSPLRKLQETCQLIKNKVQSA